MIGIDLYLSGMEQNIVQAIEGLSSSDVSLNQKYGDFLKTIDNTTFFTSIINIISNQEIPIKTRAYCITFLYNICIHKQHQLPPEIIPPAAERMIGLLIPIWTSQFEDASKRLYGYCIAALTRLFPQPLINQINQYLIQMLTNENLAQYSLECLIEIITVQESLMEIPVEQIMNFIIQPTVSEPVRFRMYFTIANVLQTIDPFRATLPQFFDIFNNNFKECVPVMLQFLENNPTFFVDSLDTVLPFFLAIAQNPEHTESGVQLFRTIIENAKEFSENESFCQFVFNGFIPLLASSFQDDDPFIPDNANLSMSDLIGQLLGILVNSSTYSDDSIPIPQRILLDLIKSTIESKNAILLLVLLTIMKFLNFEIVHTIMDHMKDPQTIGHTDLRPLSIFTFLFDTIAVLSPNFAHFRSAAYIAIKKLSRSLYFNQGFILHVYPILENSIVHEQAPELQILAAKALAEFMKYFKGPIEQASTLFQSYCRLITASPSPIAKRLIKALGMFIQANSKPQLLPMFNEALSQIFAAGDIQVKLSICYALEVTINLQNRDALVVLHELVKQCIPLISMVTISPGQCGIPEDQLDADEIYKHISCLKSFLIIIGKQSTQLIPNFEAYLRSQLQNAPDIQILPSSVEQPEFLTRLGHPFKGMCAYMKNEEFKVLKAIYEIASTAILGGCIGVLPDFVDAIINSPIPIPEIIIIGYNFISKIYLDSNELILKCFDLYLYILTQFLQVNIWSDQMVFTSTVITQFIKAGADMNKLMTYYLNVLVGLIKSFSSRAAVVQGVSEDIFNDTIVLRRLEAIVSFLNSITLLSKQCPPLTEMAVQMLRSTIPNISQNPEMQGIAILFAQKLYILTKDPTVISFIYQTWNACWSLENAPQLERPHCEFFKVIDDVGIPPELCDPFLNLFASIYQTEADIQNGKDCLDYSFGLYMAIIHTHFNPLGPQRMAEWAENFYLYTPNNIETSEHLLQTLRDYVEAGFLEQLWDVSQCRIFFLCLGEEVVDVISRQDLDFLICSILHFADQDGFEEMFNEFSVSLKHHIMALFRSYAEPHNIQLPLLQCFNLPPPLNKDAVPLVLNHVDVGSFVFASPF